MANQADIPSDLTDDDKAYILQSFDTVLNSMILYALLHGMLINNGHRHLHSVAAEWLNVQSAFIENSQNLWTVYLSFNSVTQATFLPGAIAALMSTILTDLYTIQLSVAVLDTIEIYQAYDNGSVKGFPVLYPAFILATTLWCTVLIIYRILTVAGVQHGAVYLDVVTSITKGVAPTLLIGRVAAGHTHPNDEGNGSVVSSLHFQTLSEVSTTSFQESTTESTVLEIDIEAQQQQLDELAVVVERT
ncbi:hypothetical protein IW261DRAFT_1419147 [Armillaria novae-zelandiae]|uniref:Uncharacterized protein n=1 Tax=Armillaria novae-zelandiae TaxID=153914 RepID=A0AA39UFY4_9AGAR|nr:hypothetical protein IW261DRAFT_1419147 [Armillaria novae-zelandiae]